MAAPTEGAKAVSGPPSRYKGRYEEGKDVNGWDKGTERPGVKGGMSYT